MQYRAEIDGLRALAVLPVIFFHAGFQSFSGGFVGVDVFFVISGYLITTIILKDLETEQFKLINFYERRARRILPALFFIMIACIPFAWIWMMPSDLKEFANSLIAVTTFSSNILFWRETPYFTTASELKPLLHTWSLGVEEQFYILFPLFLLGLWKIGKRWLNISLIVLFIFSLGLAQWAAYNKPSAGFFLLPTRGWELMMGAFTAVYLQKERTKFSVKISETASLFGLLFIVSSVFIFDESMPFPSVYTLLPTAGTALIILFAKEGTLVNRVLSLKYIVYIGLASYSAYLFHQPLFAFVKYKVVDEPSFLLMLMLCIATMVLAFLSLKFIESPFRSKTLYTRSQIFIISGLISIGIIFVGLLTRVASQGGEFELARLLTQSPAVYTANIDGRKFNKYRIELETFEPEYLLTGSSRIMQITEDMLPGRLLSLGVAGATLEDIVTLLDIATTRFSPNLILIGVDPWLFNGVVGPRWKSLSAEFLQATQKIEAFSNNEYLFNSENDQVEINRTSGISRMIMDLYESVNNSILPAMDVEPAIRAKIRRDGSYVYDITSANRSMFEIEEGFESNMNYSLGEYQFDQNREAFFSDLLDFYNNNTKIILVLTPYHPSLYSRIKIEKPVIIEMETKFRGIALDKGIEVIGSYNPDISGCVIEEFLDGMHPKASCMNKILSSFSE